MDQKQELLEQRITERLLVERQTPHDALRGLIAQPDAPDPMAAVFALTTVAADMAGWGEPPLERLADQCFSEAALFICELWAAGYRLEPPPE
ncbi:hypothetical protein [Celeribacter halophilus]|uniref:Uncharacterized protein n=1 Tax=Celeribacter halophilus TaxID=576117 RepID=A0A1I3S1M0_9RHOB|nr:hypothetical protein [Celeribacter halophilus]PZX11437.1 hypothetical protein LX82_01728 [Celeribacter halophilus]SFJ52724.1 hypothetical protein SAMN04488138_1066 [Celeribacter halophilus]